MQKPNLLIQCSFWSLICLLSCTPTNESNSGIAKEEFSHNQLAREYIYYAPENLEQGAPLVMVLHGFTSNAERIMEYSGMNEIAQKNGFAVVYPQGTKDKEGNTFWNVGYEFHADLELDDVDFLVQLLAYLQEEHRLSAKNTFITGMSNGGEMCYLLACQYPDKFSAAAPVAGTMMNNFYHTCTPSSTIPIFAIFGTEDDITNYDGDEENKDGWGAYKGIPSIIDFWTQRMNFETIQTDTLADKVLLDSSYVISNKYLVGNGEAKFIYYEVIGGGHDWPGAWGNQDINASEEIWQFFAKQLQ